MQSFGIYFWGWQGRLPGLSPGSIPGLGMRGPRPTDEDLSAGTPNPGAPTCQVGTVTGTRAARQAPLKLVKKIRSLVNEREILSKLVLCLGSHRRP